MRKRFPLFLFASVFIAATGCQNEEPQGEESIFPDRTEVINQARDFYEFGTGPAALPDPYSGETRQRETRRPDFPTA